MSRQRNTTMSQRRGFGQIFRGLFNRRRRSDVPPPAINLPRPFDLDLDLFGAPSLAPRRLSRRPRHRPAAVQRRREANKRARAARRVHRLRAGR